MRPGTDGNGRERTGTEGRHGMLGKTRLKQVKVRRGKSKARQC